MYNGYRLILLIVCFGSWVGVCMLPIDVVPSFLVLAVVSSAFVRYEFRR